VTEKRSMSLDPGATAAFDLPAELLDVVLRQLPPCSLASAAGVCRAWRDAAEDDTLWAVHLLARGRSLPPLKTEKKMEDNPPGPGRALTRPPSAGGSAGGGGLGALRSLKTTRKPPRPLPPPPPPPLDKGTGYGEAYGRARKILPATCSSAYNTLVTSIT